MCDCATPATWNQGGCHQVPRLPCRSGAAPCHQVPCLPRRSGAAPRASRATKPGPSAPPSAMSEAPATQNDRGCEIVPRLPRKTKVDVTKDVWLCHACHAKRPWMWDCTTPATQSAAASKCYALWSYCMWEMVCDKVMCVWVCVKLLYVKFAWLYVKFVCVRWYVTKLCVCVSVCEVIVC